jgi:hypothetical protein
MPSVSFVIWKRSSADEVATLADEPDQHLTLIADEGKSGRPRSSVMSMFSYAESLNDQHNPYDLTKYVDRVSTDLDMVTTR